MQATFLIVLWFLSLCSARSVFQSPNTVPPVPSPVLDNVANAPLSLYPKDWPEKAPKSVRFAAVLGFFNSTTVQEIYWGYTFWAAAVNDTGGIPVGSGEKLLVDLRIVHGVPAVNHSTVFEDAVVVGKADFLLGGETGDAKSDWEVAKKQNKIAMLCCHGPPTLYINATKDAAESTSANSTSTKNWLFGVHVSSEKYVDKIIRNIVVNGHSKKIALFSTYNSVDPNSSADLFSNTTCEFASKSLDQLKLNDNYANFPEIVRIKMPSNLNNDTGAFLQQYVEAMKPNATVSRTDTIIACTTDATGRALLGALKDADVRLRTLFLTVAPTNPDTVSALAKNGISMEHIISAGQWHPEVVWGASAEDIADKTKTQILWKNATDFSNKYETFMDSQNQTKTAATYTIASAAAAGYSIQWAIYQGFEGQGCNLQGWSGEAETFFSTTWNCNDTEGESSQQISSKTGLERVHEALRFLSIPTFFGQIDFDENQRNVGRDALTLQLLKNDTRTDTTIESIDFGLDWPEINNTNATAVTAKLIQEARIVLPGEYETKSIVLPFPAKDGDPSWCDAGFGLDTNNVCTACKPGSSRNNSTLTENGRITSVQQICDACSIGSFASESGLFACTDCPENTVTLEVGATSIFNCTCKPGYYNAEQENGRKCSICPLGANCPGGKTKITAAKGFWVHAISQSVDGKAENETVVETIACNPATACINEGSQVCGTGWGDNVCSMCGADNNKTDQRYFLMFGKCTKCKNPYQNLFIFIAMLIVWLVVNLVMAEDVQALALLIDWMQLMSLVGNIPAMWPDSLSIFYSVAAFFAFEIDVVSLRCLNSHWDFKWDMVVQFCLPLAIILVLSFVVLVQKSRAVAKDREEMESSRNFSTVSPEVSKPEVSKPEVSKPEEVATEGKEQKMSLSKSFRDNSMRLKKKGVEVRKSISNSALARGMKSAKQIVKQDKEYQYQFWRRVANILEITYLALTLYSLSALRGVTINGEKVVFRYPHTSQDAAVVALGIVGLVIYGLLYPAIIIMMLWFCSPECPLRIYVARQQRPPIKRHDDPGGFLMPRMQTILGWLYGEFRTEVYYMSAMHFLHRFLFAAVVSLVINTALQLLLSVILTSIFAIWFVVTRPYYHDRLNVLQAVMYASILIQLGIGTCYYSTTMFSEAWQSRFEFASFTMIVLVGIVLLWIVIQDGLDYFASNKAEQKILAYFKLHQEHNKKDFLDEFENDNGLTWKEIKIKEEKAVKKLIAIFNPVKLWTWVQKIKLEADPEAAEQKGFRSITEWFKELWEKIRPSVEKKEEFKRNDEMELFIDVARRLTETGCFNDRTGYQSLMDEAELWSFFVRKFPEIVSYLFNVTDYRSEENLDDFFKNFYLHYWMSKKTLYKMVEDWFVKSDAKKEMKPKMKRMNASRFYFFPDYLWDWAMGEFLVKAVAIKKEERPIEEYDSTNEYNFSSNPANTVPGVTWLITAQSRAQLARWLSKNRDYPVAKCRFKYLVAQIDKASLSFSDGCWEETLQRVFSMNLMAIFRTVEAPSELDRKLIDEDNDDDDDDDKSPFESEDSEIDH